MKREKTPSFDDSLRIDEAHSRPFLLVNDMYDNPNVKPQRKFRCQLNFECVQSKRDSCRSSKGVIYEDASRVCFEW